MLIHGGVNMLTFTYFMTNLEKVVVPKMEKRLKHKGFKADQIVYLYDNASRTLFFLFLFSRCSLWWVEWMVDASNERI